MCRFWDFFYSSGQTPQSPKDPVYRELSDAQDLHILDHLRSYPLDAGDEGCHVSGTCLQKKLFAGGWSEKLLSSLLQRFDNDIEKLYYFLQFPIPNSEIAFELSNDIQFIETF